MGYATKKTVTHNKTITKRSSFYNIPYISNHILDYRAHCPLLITISAAIRLICVLCDSCVILFNFIRTS